MDTKDRIKGAFIGLYFGSGVNPRFSPILEAEQSRKMFGNKKFGEYYDYPIYEKPFKLYDQHTQTKIVYDMLMKYGEITPELSKEYLMKLHKKHDVFKGDVYGPSTRKAVTKILAGENIYEMGKTGITCGSAMKTLPIAMFFYDKEADLIKNTVNACIISHNTDVAMDAAIAVNVTLASLIRGKEKFEAIAEGMKAAKKYHGKFGAKTSEPKIYEKILIALKFLKGKTLKEAEFLIPEKIGVSWFARDTIPGAFANYIVVDNPKDSSLLAMRCGGDNQTVPEIACAFLGAEKGPEIFDEDIIKKIESVNKVRIYEMAEKLIEKLFKQAKQTSIQ